MQKKLRRELKKKGKARLKKCYWFFLVLCLLLAMTGLDYGSNVTFITTNVEEEAEVVGSNPTLSSIFAEMALGDEKTAATETETAYSTDQARENKLAIVSMGHSRGVLAEMVNNVASGRVLVGIFEELNSISHSKTISRIIFILLGGAFLTFVWVFVFNMLWVTIKRVFMELRIYDHVPMKRFLFYIQMGKTWSVVKTIFLCDIFQSLWSLTVIGGFIKGYSYRQVPYIVAENPSIGAREAITLSRRMMDGHKWEIFVLDLSFLPWRILSFLTSGLVGIFYASPYMEAVDAEYYAYLREEAKRKNIPNADKLNDVYLFEKASPETLQEAYSDVKDLVVPETYEKRKGFLGFMENVFGVTLIIDEKSREYERIQGKNFSIKGFQAILHGKMYPRRLYTIKGEDVKFKKVSSMHFDRHYSVLSLIFIFFTMCIIGWAWEVALHLHADGVFINRGVMHGPWLPIYGAGGVLILMILNKLRRNPLAEFVAAVVLCGSLEYTAAYLLETFNGGTKWWDYSGYFLNIHGRVCAEGLLIFGLGGVAVVYFLGPFLDNMFRRVPVKIGLPVALLLVISFTGDMIYSIGHPNKGEGITDYTGMVEGEHEAAETALSDSGDALQLMVSVEEVS